jgi:hypothetical protein
MTDGPGEMPIAIPFLDLQVGGSRRMVASPLSPRLIEVGSRRGEMVFEPGGSN